jgi:uncharacterized membrane protein
MSFCQFGGYKAGTPRNQDLLYAVPYADPDKNATLFYQICSERLMYFNGDSTMLILMSWANEWDYASKLLRSLNEDPLKQGLLAHYVDGFTDLINKPIFVQYRLSKHYPWIWLHMHSQSLLLPLFLLLCSS